MPLQRTTGTLESSKLFACAFVGAEAPRARQHQRQRQRACVCERAIVSTFFVILVEASFCEYDAVERTKKREEKGKGKREKGKVKGEPASQ